MKPRFYIGVDVSKRKHKACIIDAWGEPVTEPFSFDNSRDGFEEFIRIVSRHVKPGKALMGFEATGHYWFAFHHALTCRKLQPVVINPALTSAFSKLDLRKAKTDPKDALSIAQALRFGRFSETHVPPQPLFEMRRLTRLRYFLVDLRTALKIRMTCSLDVVFPEYESLFASSLSPSSIQLLSSFPTPRAMLDAEPEQIETLLKTASRGRLSADRTEVIIEQAASTFGVPDTGGVFEAEILTGISLIEQTAQQIKNLDSQIVSRLENFPQYITTIPGIGDITAASIIAEIGDISRFPSGKELVAFAGLDPSVYQSGEFTGTHSHVSKRGSVYLRRSLYLCAVVARRFNQDLSEFYQRKKAEGKHSNLATIAVARKLCHIIWRIMTDNRPYKP